MVLQHRRRLQSSLQKNNMNGYNVAPMYRAFLHISPNARRRSTEVPRRMSCENSYSDYYSMNRLDTCVWYNLKNLRLCRPHT